MKKNPESFFFANKTGKNEARKSHHAREQYLYKKHLNLVHYYPYALKQEETDKCRELDKKGKKYK